MRRYALLLPILALLPGLPPAARAADIVVPPDGRSLSLTVTNNSLSLVQDARSTTLPAGASQLVFGGLSPQLIGESAQLLAEGLTVDGLSFAAQPIGPASLLRRAVGQEVTWMRPPAVPGGGETAVRGRVLSADGPVLEIDGRIEAAPPGRIVYDRLPAGLGDASTLSVAVSSPAAGPRKLALTYLTPGLSWRAEYQLWLEGEDKASLTGWGVVANHTGADFPEARLTLLAGQLHQAPRPVPMAYGLARTTAALTAPAAPTPAAPAAPAPGPTPEALAGSFLYSPSQPVSLGAGETREIALLNVPRLPAHRQLVVEPLPEFVLTRPMGPDELRGANPGRPLSVLSVEAGGPAAMALPAGVVRVFSRDSAGQPHYLGEDNLGQKAKGEAWRIALGHDAEVSVERLQTGFRPPHPPDLSWESSWQVTLANHKDHEVTVRVEERLPVDGTVAEESQPHESPDPRSLVWPVKVPAGGEAVLSYRLRRNG